MDSQIKYSDSDDVGWLKLTKHYNFELRMWDEDIRHLYGLKLTLMLTNFEAIYL